MNASYSQPSAHFERIQEQLKPFESLGLILCKIEMDSTLQCLAQLFGDIFEKEVSFGLKGSLTRTVQFEKQSQKSRLHVPTRLEFDYLQREPQTHCFAAQFPYQLTMFGTTDSNRTVSKTLSSNSRRTFGAVLLTKSLKSTMNCAHPTS